MGSFLKRDYCGFIKEMQVRGISFTGRISEITLYLVWPRKDAFPQLPILKYTLGNSDLKGKGYFFKNLYSTKNIFKHLNILGMNVKFYPVRPYSFDVSWFYLRLPVQ
jgi:hypothetical protein